MQPKFNFFITSSNEILHPQVKKIKDVLRLNVNDKIFGIKNNKKYLLEITSIEKEKISTKIIREIPFDTEPSIKIFLAQSLLKGEKFDFVIQKATEIGVYAIIPFISERTIIKLDENKKEKKLNRYKMIVQSAAEQSHREIIPCVHPIVEFSNVLNCTEEFDLSLIFFEGEKTSLKKVLKKNIKKILLIIGPEGGFSVSEIEKARKSGIIPVSLGKRILRSETASLVAMSLILFEFGDLG